MTRADLLLEVREGHSQWETMAALIDVVAVADGREVLCSCESMRAEIMTVSLWPQSPGLEDSGAVAQGHRAGTNMLKFWGPPDPSWTCIDRNDDPWTVGALKAALVGMDGRHFFRPPDPGCDASDRRMLDAD